MKSSSINEEDVPHAKVVEVNDEEADAETVPHVKKNLKKTITAK